MAVKGFVGNRLNNVWSFENILVKLEKIELEYNDIQKSPNKYCLYIFLEKQGK